MHYLAAKCIETKPPGKFVQSPILVSAPGIIYWLLVFSMSLARDFRSPSVKTHSKLLHLPAIIGLEESTKKKFLRSDHGQTFSNPF